MALAALPLVPWVVAALIGQAEVTAERLFSDGDLHGPDACRAASFPFVDEDGGLEHCVQCLQTGGPGSELCKWCPLTQTCVHRSLFSPACPKRPNFEESDLKVTTDSECRVRSPFPALQLMSGAYGPEWNHPRNLDAVRCVQWALDWEIPGSTDHDEDGKWGCISAMLREGMMAAMERKVLPDAGEESRNDLSFVQTSEEALNGKPNWYQNRKTWEPHLCQLIQKKLGEKKCYVRAWTLQDFHKLRRLFSEIDGGEPEDLDARLLESIESGPLLQLNPGAGKSGSGFAQTSDRRFKVKLGLRYESAQLMNEPNNLMALMRGDPGKVDSMYEHFAKNKHSMLNRIHGMMKIAFGDLRSYIAILDDAFYHVDEAAARERASGLDVHFTRYDLKGMSRNQKTVKGHGWCLVNGDFRQREQNRMLLTDEQCLQIRSAVSADTEFLGSHSMIDYSLALLSVNGSDVNRVSCNPADPAPLCTKEGGHLYTLSIIDYLNDQSAMKTLENWVSHGKFRNYNRKIDIFIKKVCPTRLEAQFKEELRQKSGRKALAGIDADGDGTITIDELRDFLKEIGINEDEYSVDALNTFYKELAEESESDDGEKVTIEAFKYLIE